MKTFLALATFLFSSSAFAIPGTLSNFVHEIDIGLTPGTDLANVSGNYSLGSGNNGFNFTTDDVTISLDGGRFVQTLPAGSMLPISGGRRYTGTGSGIRTLRIMNNGTFLLQIREADFTGTSTDRLEAFEMVVGDDEFEKMPNSIPVSVITGPSATDVGQQFTVSGLASTDFNSDSLTHSWSLFSKPINSLVNLSPTGSAASLTPDLPGIYVIKLVVSDASGPGIPALATIVATSTEETEPPTPGPNNGFIELIPNQTEYLLGDTATITVNPVVAESVPDYEYFYRAYYLDQPVDLIDPPTGDLYFSTGELTELGPKDFKIELYLQDVRLAQRYQATITYYQAEIPKIDAALEHETDAAIIAELQARKAEYQLLLAQAEEELEKNRTKIGETALLEFSVN